LARDAGDGTRDGDDEDPIDNVQVLGDSPLPVARSPFTWSPTQFGAEAIAASSRAV
jgi:hypothetical protein